MTGAIVVALVLGVPAAAFAIWPLLRARGRPASLLPLPPDERDQLLEAKRVALSALRELDFEHAAGYVSDPDYAELGARYEAEAAETLRALDALRPAPTPPAAPSPAPIPASGWRHPAALAMAAVALLVFGVALGVGIVRYTEPDRMADAAPTGSRPLASLEGAPPGEPPSAANAPRGPVTSEMLQGMLQAARESLFAGRYSEAIAAYQAVLKRDPKNVEALTHLGLVVAIGGNTDAALETLAKALTIDPNYPPALLYRGQLLAEVKRDVPGAIRSWEKFVAVVPEGEDRQRVVRMIAETKSGAAQKAPQ